MREDTPKLIGIDQIADGWVKKYIVHYQLADGTPHDYECASRKGLDEFRATLEANAAGEKTDSADAVCIVARTPRESLVMIREFRYPINSWSLGFPAGLVDPGEDLVTCAIRELQEETGFIVAEDSPIALLPQAGYSSTGLTDETVQIVFVEADSTGDVHTEPGELIEVFELPIADIREFLDNNTQPIGTRAQLVLELFAEAQE